MYLKEMRLMEFKSYGRAALALSPRVNCFTGPNGIGKTNLLEAIYFLCMSKSYANLAEQYNLRHGSDFSRLEGHFVLDDAATDRIVIKLQKRKRKVIERNGTAYARVSEHVGRYPVVIVVPDDIRLVHEGSEARRRLVDNSLSQTDPAYLRHLLAYNKLVASRNATLKQLDGRPDHAGLLDVYDRQLLEPAAYLHTARRAFAEPFGDYLRAAHRAISGARETVDVTYRSQLFEQPFAELLAERREKDRILLRTSGGIHRDDLVFTQDGHPLRRVASQGQLKSFVLALKLAQYRLLEAQTNRSPILLLDDIFDKLDRVRVRQLLDLVLGSAYGQLFITDTDPDRVTRLIDEREGLQLRSFALPLENGE